MPGDSGSDPLVSELRAQITATDLEILAAVNRRLDLVRRLKEHKAVRGYEFLDDVKPDDFSAEV